MPGPHFNSKRLQKARNVHAEFAPGSVPRVGTRLFTLRLLPRTVESNCGCRIPKPPVVAAPAGVVVSALLENGADQVRDPLDYNGTNNTSWIAVNNIQVGDTISYIHPNTNVLTTTTVRVVVGNYMIMLDDAHNVANATVDITLL